MDPKLDPKLKRALQRVADSSRTLPITRTPSQITKVLKPGSARQGVATAIIHEEEDRSEFVKQRQAHEARERARQEKLREEREAERLKRMREFADRGTPNIPAEKVRGQTLSVARRTIQERTTGPIHVIRRTRQGQQVVQKVSKSTTSKTTNPYPGLTDRFDVTTKSSLVTYKPLAAGKEDLTAKRPTISASNVVPYMRKREREGEVENALVLDVMFQKVERDAAEKQRKLDEEIEALFQVEEEMEGMEEKQKEQKKGGSSKKNKRKLHLL